VAHIRRLPSGSYNAIVRLPNGKRKSITDPLKRVVEQKARKLEVAAAEGNLVTIDHRFTVARWHADWSGTRRIETATAKKNQSHWRNHVEPRWGGETLTSIRRSQVQRWIVDMEKAGVGPDTVHAAYNLLAGMLTDAVLEGRLGASPCREIDLPRIVKRPPRWLTKDEYGRVQLALAELPRAPVWQALVGLGAYSGLRALGELAGLDVEHIDFDRNRVWVSQVMTRSGLRPYPKNDFSVRSVPFPEEVAAMLWRIVGDRGSGPVFTSPTGERVNESNFRNRIWRPALTAAGVGYESPYVMRHTAASWWIQAGLPDYRVARLLGHSSTRMLGVYAHLDPNRDEDVRAAWGELTHAEAADPRVTHAEKQKSPRPSGRGL
jgi:integrase